MHSSELRKNIVLVTPPGRAIGFCLAGVDTRQISAPEQFCELVDTLVAAGETGIIAAPELMRDWIDSRRRKSIDRLVTPALLFYHFPASWSEPAGVEEALAVMVRHTLGYRFKIRL